MTSENPIAPDTLSSICLELMGVYSNAHLPSGIYRLRPEALAPLLDAEISAMVLSLQGYVLSEAAGEEVVEKTVYIEHKRPRWMPKWVWNRVPTQHTEVTLRVKPKWTYPQSTIQLPDLGKGYGSTGVVEFRVDPNPYRFDDDEFSD